ncbi:STAS domain-containing protein [Alkalicoccobacillus murimartini]|uniref:RsbT co-antagonist protein RsbR n=1 Tax=Alkalicoccobacillus murimartini TaxID=171685 RepID=A0ABT9YL09_9BACI|nr:STAS domain-containing protein [Alkalicoccobacillus murimartini]MDQ0208563.1 rsbT co-antagonist protein RsbR [Alkalicoccobacillus murimartini]
MQSSALSYLQQYQSQIIEQWDQQLSELRNESEIKASLEKAVEHTNQEYMTLILQTAKRNEEDSLEGLKAFTEQYIQSGRSLSYFTKALQGLRRAIHNQLREISPEDGNILDIYSDLNQWIDNMSNMLVTEYIGSWEDTLEMQKLSLLELSAPLIPVFEGITVMPLIGSIDTTRAKLIMENLLEGVIKNRSRVVLIDITGVPIVDTMVAHHIIEASEAVRLIGATSILVGIRPEIAQTIVNLGIDLTKFPTKSTLQKGMQKALEMCNQQTIEL